MFKFNPSISFHVKCRTVDEADDVWEVPSASGKVLMEYDEYPWSERYGWLQDRFALSWQVTSSGGAEVRQKITPLLMFVGHVCGKAEEAVNFYTSVFSARRPGSGLAHPQRYGTDAEEFWIRVSDNGPGIPLEGQEKIFKPFYRGAASSRFPRGRV